MSDESSLLIVADADKLKKIVSNLHVGLKHIGHIKCQNLNLLTLANNYIMCHFEIGLETTINVY